MDWQTIIIKTAPTIGTSIDTPASLLLVEFLNDNYFDEKHDEDYVIEHFKNIKADDLTRLKELDSVFAKRLKELNINVYDLTESNNKFDEIRFKHNTKPQVILSTIFVFGFFIVLWYATVGKLTADPTLRDILMLLMGVLVREMSTIMQFWFGSSQSSKDKSESMINNLSSKQDLYSVDAYSKYDQYPRPPIRDDYYNDNPR